MLKITHIDPDSPLISLIFPGDILQSINGNEIHDHLDYYFQQASASLKLEIIRKEKSLKIRLRKDYFQSLGLSFPEMKPFTCGNNCAFCFVDQHPPGVRKSLLIKDEDYRFSFLYGNFITLSNLSKKTLDRIRTYRLFPLYISVHAMNSEVRNRLLGRKRDDGFLDKFRILADSGITLHTQVVIVPEWNDGEILKDTIERLAEYHPAVASIALIPVGLTKHRAGLTKLRLLTANEAHKIITLSLIYRRRFEKQFNSPLVYCADEMFLLAGKSIPSHKYYGEFPQIENGVGMVRRFLTDFNRRKRFFPSSIEPERKMILVTGISMAPFLKEKILPVLQQSAGLKAELLVVENHYLGNTVTVAGLLAGQDILEALKGHPADLIVLPPDCVNQDGVFLDDISLVEFQEKVLAKVMVYNYTFNDILRRL